MNTRWHNGGIINELNISMNVFALISFLRPHSIYRVLIEENLESTRYKKSSNHVLKENIKQTIICKILSKIKAYNTRYSHSVSRHSTDRARRSFTSVFRREPVFSTWYGRRRFQWHFEHFQIIFYSQIIYQCNMWGQYTEFQPCVGSGDETALHNYRPVYWRIQIVCILLWQRLFISTRKLARGLPGVATTNVRKLDFTHWNVIVGYKWTELLVTKSQENYHP